MCSVQFNSIQNYLFPKTRKYFNNIVLTILNNHVHAFGKGETRSYKTFLRVSPNTINNQHDVFKN